MTLQRLRTVARVSARALVVAGFAGGVWLLTSTAAHASVPASAPTMTQPVLAPATGPALRLLGDVLAAKPAALPVQHHTRSATVSVNRRSVPLLASQATPAGHIHRPVASVATSPVSALLSTVSDLVRPLPVPADLITSPVAGLLSPVLTGRWAAVPATVAGHAVPGSATTSGTPRAAQHSTTGRPSAGTVLRMGTASRPAAPGTRQVPDLPDRAPLPAYPGSDTMGISTTASGSGSDAGGYAVVSAPVAAGQPSGVERLRASGVTVRLLLADAPTFAPD